MDDVYYKLAEIANLSFRDSLDYVIAKEMLQNIDTISDMSIDKIANICCTSTASITRFCQKIGYDSFKELKYNINQNKSLHKLIDTYYEKNLNKDINIKKAILDTKIKFEYIINYSLLTIEKSSIDFVIERIINNNRIAIFCATHELSAVVLFQALLKQYHKKVDIILCNTDPSKIDYVLENVDFIIYLTYGGRWMRRSLELVKKVINSSIENCVICLNDEYIKKYSFDKIIKFNFAEQLNGNYFEFFVFLFSVISSAITFYYDESS